MMAGRSSIPWTPRRWEEMLEKATAVTAVAPLAAAMAMLDVSPSLWLGGE
jgi:hypothetical protein